MKKLQNLLVLIGLCVWFSTIGLTGSLAQTALPGLSSNTQTVDAQTPSPNDVKELIRLLEDQRIKNWLEREANNLTADNPETTALRREGLRKQLASFLDRTRERGKLLQGAWQNLPNAPTYLAQEWQNNLSGSATVRSLTYVLIFLFIGSGLEWLYRQYTSRRLLHLQLSVPESLSGRLKAAALRALLIFGGLVVFSIGSIGGFLSFEWNSLVEALVLNVLILVIVLRTIATASMFFIAPRVRELRLVPFGDVMAKQVHGTVLIAFSAFAIAMAISDIFSRLTGTAGSVTNVEAASFSISIFVGLVCLFIGLITIWKIASIAALKQETADGDEPITLQPRGFNWRLYLSVLAILAFALWLFAATDLMWTALILGLLPAALGLTRGWVNYFFDEAEDYVLGQKREPETLLIDEPTSETEQSVELVEAVDVESDQDNEERRPYETIRLVTIRFFRFLLVIVGLLIVLAAWGTDIFSLAESPTFFGKVASVLIDLIVAILIADLVWTWAKAAIDRRLADYKPPEGPQAPGPEARMATLLPLLRIILLVTLVITVGLSVLSSAGVNIAPLIAGAGVLGVAIGFGAQSLVKDIVSGIFFLIDDAFRIGEYVEIGNLRGVVEGMSIRSLRVRHHRGAVHTIPFGELTSLSNYSRDWVIMKMEFRVPFETDIKLVKKLVKRIGAEMIEDPLYQNGFIEPLKSQGVRRMEEFNMVVGVKFMAKPGEQWVIRRDAYQKIVNAFEANGIRLAERNVKVEVISDRPLSDEEQEAVIGAAQDAVEQQAGPPVPVSDEP